MKDKEMVTEYSFVELFWARSSWFRFRHLERVLQPARPLQLSGNMFLSHVLRFFLMAIIMATGLLGQASVEDISDQEIQIFFAEKNCETLPQTKGRRTVDQLARRARDLVESLRQKTREARFLGVQGQRSAEPTLSQARLLAEIQQIQSEALELERQLKSIFRTLEIRYDRQARAAGRKEKSKVRPVSVKRANEIEATGSCANRVAEILLITQVSRNRVLEPNWQIQIGKIEPLRIPLEDRGQK